MYVFKDMTIEDIQKLTTEVVKVLRFFDPIREGTHPEDQQLQRDLFQAIFLGNLIMHPTSKMYSDLSSVNHEQWKSWAEEAMNTKRFPYALREQWIPLFVSYKELPDEIKEKYKSQGELLLTTIKLEADVVQSKFTVEESSAGDDHITQRIRVLEASSTSTLTQTEPCAEYYIDTVLKAVKRFLLNVIKAWRNISAEFCHTKNQK